MGASFSSDGDARAARGDLGDDLRHPLVELLYGAAGRGLGIRGLAHGGGKSLVQLVIRQAGRLPGEIDLRLGLGEAGKLPRGIQHAAIHDGGFPGRAEGRGIAGQPGGGETGQQQNAECAREDFAGAGHGLPELVTRSWSSGARHPEMNLSKVVHSGQPMKRVTLIAGAIFAVLLAAALALPFLIDANAFRPLLESRLSVALGREVKLGDLKLSILAAR